jgi:urease accessory protein
MIRNLNTNLLVYIVMFVACMPGIALAHSAESGASLFDGMLHPALGLDHLLAMVSVGVLSAQIGGRAIWSVPTTFVAVMAFGGFLGFEGISLISVESGIGFSVVVLGIAIAAAKRIPVIIAMIFVGFFAIFHGYAHGAEMPVMSDPIYYALGFLSGTAVIHLLGVLIGYYARNSERGVLFLRTSGAVVAATGVVFLIR